MDVISSRQNTLVKQLKKLGDSKRERAEAGQIIAEGVHLLQMQISTGVMPSLVALAERCQDDSEIKAVLGRCEPGRVVILADAIFDQIAPTDTPSGLLFVSDQTACTQPLDVTMDVLLLDRVQDPGNVGSLIRTAVAAGVRQIVLSPGCADAWSPRCLRAGQGAQWLANIHADVVLNEFLTRFPGAIAATLLERGVSLYDQDLSAPTAWLFGNEGQGLDPQLAALASHRITIPMPGGMESLNVNAAAAVCLFEQVRQRSSLNT